MKEIPLRNSDKVALVDEDDYPLLSRHKWAVDGNGAYARCSIRTRTILMHTLILPVGSAQQVDHINRNTLDNRKENLRPAYVWQNIAYSRRGKNATSKFLGVCNRKGVWEAAMLYQKKYLFIGRFSDERAAAIAYDVVSLALRDGFAPKTNLLSAAMSVEDVVSTINQSFRSGYKKRKGQIPNFPQLAEQAFKKLNTVGENERV